MLSVPISRQTNPGYQRGQFMSRRIAIIDGNSLMHRAFHAVPTYMTAPDGRPTNAVFGFISMFLKLVETLAPDAIIVAFDRGIPEFRLRAIEQYKAQRPPTDENLKTQFPMIKEVLDAMAVPVIELDGWEGDDILGTLARQAKEAGVQSLLVTGDKDALQLVDENTLVVNTKSGMSDVVVYDSDAVLERWGVTPEQVPDFLGLMGDSSDNIPGVPGVGEKKARALLEEYGTLEAVLANAANIKGKLGENLRDNADLALSSREAATISCDVPVECPFDEVFFPAYSAESVSKEFRKLAMTSHLRKLLSLIGDETGSGVSSNGSASGGYIGGAPATAAGNETDDPAAIDATSPLMLLEGDVAQAALTSAIANSQPIAIVIDDTNQEDQGTLFSASEQHLFCATASEVLSLGTANTAATLARLYREAAMLIAFDHKKLLGYCLPPDSSEPQIIDYSEIDPSRLFDCQLASYLIDSTRVPASLQQLAAQYPNTQATLAESTLPPAAALAATLLSLAQQMQAQLQEIRATECYEKIEKPLIAVLAQMQRTGIKLDTAVLADINKGYTAEIENLRAKIIAEAGESFNLDSPKQLGTILFEKLKLPTIKKKKTGYSTDASVLEELKALHPLPSLMLEYRELAKLKSTYLDALPRLVANDGNIHTTFNQTVTATGRLSSSDPNLQNIPVRTDTGREIRHAFVPDPAALNTTNAVLLGADYSQIELRLLAHLSADPALVAAFIAGEDFHTMTAAYVWSVDPSEVTPEIRSRAKAVNFGIVYGQQAYGLSQSLGITFADAQSLINRYFSAFPEVRTYLDKTVALAHEQGWVDTIFGRRRYIRELYSSNTNQRNFGERTAMNHPMQGSAADIIKLAMIEVANRMQQSDVKAQLILQVHDELVFNCASEDVEALSELVREAMENVVKLKVPLVVGIQTGSTWAEAH